MYKKEFDVRWSDIDANRHLANSAYQNFMSHTRMGYLIEMGFGQREMHEHNIGPVIFNENIFYFKEVHQGRPITVTCELIGLSEDGSLFSFRHNFYDHKGRNLTRGTMMGAWMDLSSRRMTALPDELLQKINNVERADDFKWLTREDTRSHGQAPNDLIS
ncbi:hypothetical protein JCM19294_2477 [Nonlabens tegetincola]|uniref:Thioesterase n=1 Tax=Nonlabens tegetincola TaxID=323273 RepID=A0A090PY44_9FLAO|nr:acyl-CoA thioesterase [Nonlabens tegetincola]GAK95695.1 hypothetical protein JCM19294_2477 [Nonlabens tegetincola]